MSYPRSGNAVTVGIVGAGPRGISVLERLAIHLSSQRLEREVHIVIVDDTELGAGRVWRTDQPDWYTMNTVIGEVTMYSGAPDDGPPRPGVGPSLLEWLRNGSEPEFAHLGANDYAPRVLYGRYLRFVYSSILRSLREVAVVHEIRGNVEALHLLKSGYRLEVIDDNGTRALESHAVVLATGYARNVLSGQSSDLAFFAERVPGLHYIAGDSAADMDFSGLLPGMSVGVIGMGLSFYDVMLALTIGRGGRFVRVAQGEIRYQPSGQEPRLVAGSRSGLIIPARGRNQKPAVNRFRPRFLTPQAVARLRAAAVSRYGSPALDFDRDILPLLRAEIYYVYYTTYARHRRGSHAADQLGTRLRTHGPDERGWDEILADEGLADVTTPELGQLARPFRDKFFDNPAAFHDSLLQLLVEDLREASRGNVDSPLKAALDVIRDVRDVIRQAVDFGGLHPISHRDAFLGDFLPVMSLLSAGPPLERVQQVIALLDAGLLEIVGPDAHFHCDHESDNFIVESPQVAGSRRQVSALIDSRIPVPDLDRNSEPLFRQLVADGVVTEFVNETATHRFATGGLAVTRAESRVMDANDRPHRGLYAIGIPTEHSRWFTQVGSSRPGSRTSFHRDADVIAVSILRRLAAVPVTSETPDLTDRLVLASSTRETHEFGCRQLRTPEVPRLSRLPLGAPKQLR